MADRQKILIEFIVTRDAEGPIKTSKIADFFIAYLSGEIQSADLNKAIFDDAGAEVIEGGAKVGIRWVKG